MSKRKLVEPKAAREAPVPTRVRHHALSAMGRESFVTHAGMHKLIQEILEEIILVKQFIEQVKK